MIPHIKRIVVGHDGEYIIVSNNNNNNNDSNNNNNNNNNNNKANYKILFTINFT